jgi:hypothetical protein
MRKTTAIFLSLFVLLAFLTAGCVSSKNYQRAYRRAWRKIVNSQAWRDALAKPYQDQAGTKDISSPLPGEPVDNVRGIDPAFLDTYRSLVFRAYFRTIAEAEKADARIYEAYRRLRAQRQLPDNRRNATFQLELAEARNRYQAHRKMLDGLKSWKSFNEYGSDDLDFFMREQLPRAYEMHLEGKKDEAIVRYLVYRLADLYHFEDQEFLHD